GPRRWAAIMIGFVGVLIITRPGTGNVGLPALYVLAAAFIYGIYAILTRKLSGADDPIITFLMTPVAGVFIFAPGALAVWEAPPDMLHWVLLFTIGVFGGIGHGLLILATQNAPAPVLAPFIYIQLVWMAAAGYLIFGDVPDTMTFIGAAIVVVSGVYLWFRERKIAASDK
ncbi:MAG: DMT family transporter, partial [Pseudomonadota bacterium]